MSMWLLVMIPLLFLLPMPSEPWTGDKGAMMDLVLTLLPGRDAYERIAS